MPDPALQVEPFMRASVFPMPDAPIMPRDMAAVEARLGELRDVMRDVQNLASKFRCDETASIQQAMRWVHGSGLLPSVMKLPTLDRDALQNPSRGAHWQDIIEPHRPGTSRDCGAEVAGLPSASSSAPHEPPGSLSPRATAAGSDEAAGASIGQSSEAPLDGGEPEEDTAEFASRFSYAALASWLPQSSHEEKVDVMRGRMLAMDTYSVSARLAIACEVMAVQRDSLAAKCAIMGAEGRGRRTGYNQGGK